MHPLFRRLRWAHAAIDDSFFTKLPGDFYVTCREVAFLHANGVTGWQCTIERLEDRYGLAEGTRPTRREAFEAAIESLKRCRRDELKQWREVSKAIRDPKHQPPA